MINETKEAEKIVHTDGSTIVTEHLSGYADRIIAVADSYTSRVLTGVSVADSYTNRVLTGVSVPDSYTSKVLTGVRSDYH